MQGLHEKAILKQIATEKSVAINLRGFMKRASLALFQQ